MNWFDPEVPSTVFSLTPRSDMQDVQFAWGDGFLVGLGRGMIVGLAITWGTIGAIFLLAAVIS